VNFIIEIVVEILLQCNKLITSSFEAYYAKAKANKEAGRLHEAVNDLTEALRVAPQNHCELHRVILRIKEEITANEEKTSSSSAASTPSHTDKPPPKTKYNIPEHRISCEITNSSPIQSNEEHIYTNGLSNFNSVISNSEIDSDPSIQK